MSAADAAPPTTAAMAPHAPDDVPWRALVESSPEAAFLVCNGVVRYLNPAAQRLFGAPTAAAMLGTDILDRIHPEDHALALARRRAVLDGHGVAPLTEMRLVSFDGRILHVEIQATAVVYGGERGTWATARDISSRRALEEQVRRSQKLEAVGRLAGGIAHDFNNTLAVILGLSECALGELPKDHPLRDDLDTIHRAAQHSAQLTRQLLTYARQQPIAPRALDLNEAVRVALRMLRPLIGEQIALQFAPASGLWPVTLDPSQLDQILTNLGANARDAIAGTGTVRIETANQALDAAACHAIHEAEPGEYVRLSVTDDGCGMPPEMLGRVFEPFFTTKGVGEGTGLGLSTVYGIVRQNHGCIAVRSAPGEGTRFDLYFPRRHAAPVADATPHATSHADASAPGGETILLVEDEVAILELTARALRAQGYTVLTAASPAEALALEAEHQGPIDLLATDVMMPGMTGPELARRLLARRPTVRCLYISGYSADLVAQDGRLEDETAFLGKPFTLAQLVRRVRTLLDRAGAA